jgi:DNA-binding MarR family transcriptional regulator
MRSNYSFLMSSDIMYAIDRHNAIMCDERLTLLDGAILCLVKSFSDKNQQFFMSNQEMKKLFASDPGTIQRSIDRLVRKGLLKKEKAYIDMRQRRYLTYQSDAVTSLIEQYE